MSEGLRGSRIVASILSCALAVSLSGCSNVAPEVSSFLSQIDSSALGPLAVSSGRQAGQAPNVNSGIMSFDVRFGQPINTTTFDITDLTNAGSAGHCTWTIIDSGDHMNFTVTAASPSGEGTVLPKVIAGGVMSVTGQPFVSSTGADSVFWDQTAPVVTRFMRTAGQPALVANLPASFDLVFNEEIDPSTLSTADFKNEGGASGLTWSFTNLGNNKNFLVKVTSAAGDGDILPKLKASAVTDVAGNPSAETTAGESVILDRTGPAAPVLSRVSPTVSSSSVTAPIFGVSTESATDVASLFLGSTCGGATVGTGSGFPIADVTVSPALGAGSYTFSARVADSLGNLSSCSTASLGYQVVFSGPTAASSLTWNVSSPSRLPSVVAQWTPSADASVVNQKVWFYTGPSCATFESETDLASASASSLTISPADGSETSFKIVSFNGGGASTESNCSTTAMRIDRTPPAKASSLFWSPASPSNTSIVTANWTPSSDGELANQKIQYFTDSSCIASAAAPFDLGSATQTSQSASHPQTSFYFAVTSIDTAGNESVSTCSSEMKVDTVAPTVQSVTSVTGNGTYTEGDSVFLDVKFTEPVTIFSGTPQLLLELGSIDYYAVYISGSGTDTLHFKHVVNADDVSADLDYSSANALSGVVLKDAAGNPATLTLPAPGAAGSLGANADLNIVGTFATVTILESTADFGTVAVGGNSTLTLNLHNGGVIAATTITPSVTGDFSFVGGSFPGGGGTCSTSLNAGANCTVILKFSPTATGARNGNFSFTYNTGAGSGNAGLSLAGTGANAAALTVTNSTYDFGSVFVDASKDMTLTVTNTGGVTASALSGSGISGIYQFKGGSYPGTGGTCGTPTLAPAATCTIVVVYLPNATGGTGGTMRVSYHNGATGTYIDRGISGTGLSPTISFSAPTQSSVGSTSSATVTVSMAVGTTATDVSKLKVNYTGTANCTLTTGGTIYSRTATLSSCTGAGTATIATDAGFGVDSAANLTAPAVSGTSIAVDAVAPTVTSVTSSTPNNTYAVGATISIQVTFSKSVFISTTPSLLLETGTTDRTAAYVSGNGTPTLNFTYTVQTGDVSADLEVHSANALTGSLTDASGNPATLTLPTLGGPFSLSGTKSIVIGGALTITVTGKYAAAPNWNDWVNDDGIYAACSNNLAAPCLHGGERRKAILTGISSCSGLTATDTLGAFDWTCVDTTAPAVFYGALKAGKGLNDLISSTPAWLPNTLTVMNGAILVAQSGAPTNWWGNQFVSISPLLTSPASYLADQGSKIYVATANANTGGIIVGADKIALVVRPGVTITSIGGIRCSYSGGAGSDTSATVCSGPFFYTWFEGTFASDSSMRAAQNLFLVNVAFSRLQNVNLTNADGSGLFMNNVARSVLQNVSVSNTNNGTNTSYGIYAYGSSNNFFNGTKISSISGTAFYLDSSSTNKLVATTATDSFNGVRLSYSNSNVFTDTKVASISSGPGIHLTNSYTNLFSGFQTVNSTGSSGITLTGSSYNRFVNGRSSNNGSYGMYADNGSGQNIFAGVTVSANALSGIYTLGNSTVVAFATVMNNASKSVYSNTSSGHVFFQHLYAGNGYGLTMASTTNTTVAQIASYAPTASIASIVLADSTSSSTSSSGNLFTGNLIFSGNSSNCSSVGASAVLYNPGCTSSGSDGSTTVGGAVIRVAQTSIANGIVGPVSSADSGQPSATAGVSGSTINDWLSFGNLWRSWGYYDNLGNLWPSAVYSGRCSTPPCLIFDFSLKTSSNLLNRSENYTSSNGAFAFDPSNCPGAVDGSKALYIGATGNYALMNAIERMDDGDGNENGLCESGEDCIYQPNYGAYYGHGTPSAGICRFVNGPYVINVKMHVMSANGN